MRLKVNNWLVVAEMSDGQNVIVELPYELENNLNEYIEEFEQEINDKIEQELGE